MNEDELDSEEYSSEDEEMPKFDGVEIDVRETEFITQKY
jgi:hypothetical protein